MRRLASMYAALIVLALSLSGCAGSAQPDVTPPPEMPPAEDIAAPPLTTMPDSGMGAQSFSYLEGFWAVSAVRIEGDSVAPADPSGTWEFAVMGDSMTVLIGERRYEGLLGEVDGGWSYRGMVTGSSASGEMLGGYLEIAASDTGDDTFTGALLQAVDQDGGTPGYTARWTIEAARQ